MAGGELLLSRVGQSRNKAPPSLSSGIGLDSKLVLQLQYSDFDECWQV